MQARQQIRDASFVLFAQRGLRSVGVDELIEASGVAKATFYKHFRSKDELKLAYLEDLYQRRMADYSTAVKARGTGPAAMLGLFDVLEGLSHGRLPHGASFVHLLMDSGPDTPAAEAIRGYSGRLRDGFAHMAKDAGLRDPEEFAHSLQFIIKAALVCAVEGDMGGLLRGRRMTEELILAHTLWSQTCCPTAEPSDGRMIEPQSI